MTNVGRAAERIMGMTDAVWERHANPWSGWTRMMSLPLLTLAVWSRVWIGGWSLLPIGLLMLWIWINPRIFPRPHSVDNWMSQGVLGERIWLASTPETLAPHHRRAIRSIVGISSVGAVLYVVGLIWLEPISTLCGLSISILGKLWFVDRMVWLYREASLPAAAWR